MNEAVVLAVVVLALLVGLAAGWWFGTRPLAAARAEEARRTDEFKRAITDLAAAEERARAADGIARDLATVRDDRDAARQQLATLKAEAAAFEARLQELREAKDVMAAQFGDVAHKLLGEAQRSFLERADARFRESERTSGQNLKAMLQPVSERLQRYEEHVGKAEAERRDAFGTLTGLIDSMRIGQERVSSEAAKLVNALRNAPKARGRWGEQQLRNVLESCGLSEHCDFQTEVAITADDGARLRPDVVVQVPGGQSLVIDAKVSLNAYQDAFGAVDEVERTAGLTAHAAAMRAHVNGLGNKAYWSQFKDAPDYVVMFVPGEHFLSAALEQDPTLWDFAFDKKVLLATPTNLIAIARTVAAVWRQEKLAKEAQAIGQLGKELYARLAVMGGHVARLGKNLEAANGAYNSLVGSLESQVLTSARRFEALNVDTAGKSLDALPVVEGSPRPLTKLALTDLA